MQGQQLSLMPYRVWPVHSRQPENTWMCLPQAGRGGLWCSCSEGCPLSGLSVQLCVARWGILVEGSCRWVSGSGASTGSISPCGCLWLHLCPGPEARSGPERVLVPRCSALWDRLHFASRPSKAANRTGKSQIQTTTMAWGLS